MNKTAGSRKKASLRLGTFNPSLPSHVPDPAFKLFREATEEEIKNDAYDITFTVLSKIPTSLKDYSGSDKSNL
jgi:hypothetical protein